MRVIVVAGLLTVALFVAVLGAIGAQLPVFTQSSGDEALPAITQHVPGDVTPDRYRG